jgi:hypothetical protein
MVRGQCPPYWLRLVAEIDQLLTLPTDKHFWKDGAFRSPFGKLNQAVQKRLLNTALFFISIMPIARKLLDRSRELVVQKRHNYPAQFVDSADRLVCLLGATSDRSIELHKQEFGR